MKPAPPEIERLHYGPAAARQLGIPTHDLNAIIRHHRYPFTAIRPGGQPGDRGRTWALSDSQLAAILRGQARQHAPPEPEAAAGPRTSPVSPDGVDRLRRRKRPK